MRRTRKIASPTAVTMLLGAAALFSGVPARDVSAFSPQQGVSPASIGEQDQPNAAPEPSRSQAVVPIRLPRGKKLIMTDGSFQLAREYSVDGDRVRYWSLERSDWEEIPSSLVDWDATHKADVDQAKQDADLKAKIQASALAERTKDIDVDASLEVKPGIFLPDGVGLFAVEDKLVFPMKQSAAVSKRSTSREIAKVLTGVPVIPSKETLEIPGPRAAMRIPTAEPEFFMRPSDGREPRFALLRAQVKGGHRELESVNIYFGQEAHQTKEVEVQTWTPARGVFRYTVNERLEPGEYAFVEMTSEGINGYVWDFGIDAPVKKLRNNTPELPVR